MPSPTSRGALDALDEPVKRYLRHALPDGPPTTAGLRLTMAGRINVGRWLSFRAVQEFEGHAFAWRAWAGLGPVRVLRVVDRYRDGSGSTDGRLFGLVPFMHAADADTARAAAGRAAAESVWMPQTLWPAPGIDWRAEDDGRIVVGFDVAPERPELTLRIDGSGAVQSVWLMRWGNVRRDGFGYIPFGGEVHAEQRFGDIVLPSALTVGWWYGTPRYKPFFEARITSAAPLGRAS
jgi:hypothetical protein